VSQFPGKVELVGGAGGMGLSAGESALDKVSIIESNVAYLRVTRIGAGLPGDLTAAGRALTGTNRIAGAILDLRFAGGDDYGAAETTAKWFTDKSASRPFAGPLAILVNDKTRGAAETLAAALRAKDAGLIIGNRTAGEAMTFKEFVLKDGERLLIASTPAKIDGKAIPADGLKPDIAVAVNAVDERSFWENPYTTLATGTNLVGTSASNFLPLVDRTSEADLVRLQQQSLKRLESPNGAVLARPADENDDGDKSVSARTARPPRLVLRDPVLVRAVDLVKGLSVMRGSRS